jgi:hypothetical protein
MNPVIKTPQGAFLLFPFTESFARHAVLVAVHTFGAAVREEILRLRAGFHGFAGLSSRVAGESSGRHGNLSGNGGFFWDGGGHFFDRLLRNHGTVRRCSRHGGTGRLARGGIRRLDGRGRVGRERGRIETSRLYGRLLARSPDAAGFFSGFVRGRFELRVARPRGREHIRHGIARPHQQELGRIFSETHAARLVERYGLTREGLADECRRLGQPTRGVIARIAIERLDHDTGKRSERGNLPVGNGEARERVRADDPILCRGRARREHQATEENENPTIHDYSTVRVPPFVRPNDSGS